MDAVYRNRRGVRRALHAYRPEREEILHGCHAPVFSGAAVCGRALYRSYLFGDRAACRERTYKSDGSRAALRKEEVGRDTRRRVRHYAYAVDMHSILYVPAELHVEYLLRFRRGAGGDRIRGVGVLLPGAFLRFGEGISEYRKSARPSCGVFLPHGIYEKGGARGSRAHGRVRF